MTLLYLKEKTNDIYIIAFFQCDPYIKNNNMINIFSHLNYILTQH